MSVSGYGEYGAKLPDNPVQQSRQSSEVTSVSQAASASLTVPTIFQKLDKVEGLLTSVEVCGFLSCHPKTLYEWTRQGRITSFRLGRTLKYDPADVYAFLTKRRLKAKQ